MDINIFTKKIEELVPPVLQEEWDNSGWQLKISDEVNDVLVALEITDAVIEEAVSKGADLIITHHPLIFTPLRMVDDNEIISTQIIKLIRAGISVYSTHTPFDKLSGGNNDYLGQILGITGISVSAMDESGYLRTGFLCEDNKVSIADFIEHASKKLNVSSRLFRFSGNIDAYVKKIGWCTGAGAFLLKAAADEGCDLFLTGDVKYHDAQLAKAIGINVLDLGHFATERIFGENLISLLTDNGLTDDIRVRLSEIDINPFNL